MMSSPSNDNVISVTELSAGYGLLRRIRIIDHVSFTIGPGQIIGLVGPNGSGKTTLMEAIVNPARRTSGNVYIGDRELRPGEIAFIPQNPARSLSPWLRVRDEITLPLIIAGQNQMERVKRLRTLLGSTAVHVPVERRTYQLSGGQKTRVAFLRALSVERPGVVVADEPFEGLDSESRAAAVTELKALAARRLPVLVSSHRLDDLEELGATLFYLDGMPVTHVVPEHRASGSALPKVGGVEKQFAPRADAILLNILGICLGLIAWAIVAALVHRPGLFPEPLSVFRASLKLLRDGQTVHALFLTIGRALAGWIIGNLIAIPVGILIGYFVRAFSLSAPWLYLGRALPAFLLIGPIRALVAGHATPQIISLTTITVMLISLQIISISAVRAPRTRIDTAQSFGANASYILTRIMPFEALTGILAALEVTLPLAVIVTIVVETYILSPDSYGLRVFNHLDDSNAAVLFALIVFAAAISSILLALLRVIGRHGHIGE